MVSIAGGWNVGRGKDGIVCRGTPRGGVGPEASLSAVGGDRRVMSAVYDMDGDQGREYNKGTAPGRVDERE